MDIRRATPDDIDILAGLRITFTADVRGPMEPAAQAGYTALLKSYFAEALAGEDFLALIGERDGAVVGAAFLSVHRSPPRPGQADCRTGHITNVYVAPALRRQGHATRLMQAVMAESRDALGLSSFDLTATDEGRPLYEKLGFAEGRYPYMRLNDQP